MRTRLRTAEDNDSLDKIIDAANKIISTQGFTAMSMRQLAKQADLQAGSIYYHFESKNEILEEVLSQIQQQRNWLWGQISRSSKGACELLNNFISFMVERSINHSQEEKLLRYEIRHLELASRSRLADEEFQLFNELRLIIKRGINDHLFDVDDIDCVCNALMSMCCGVSDIVHSDSSPSTLSTSISTMAAKILGCDELVRQLRLNRQIHSLNRVYPPSTA